MTTMQLNQRSYALSLEQVALLIVTLGMKRTILAAGHMGTGKSTLLKMIGKLLPDHKLVYFDGTTKDAGDIVIPKFKDLEGNDYFSSATNEELGFHLDVPVVIMIDELKKCLPPVKNALLRVMLERILGDKKLHPDSIVFATANLGEEGVGDSLMAHHGNRLIEVPVRKSTNVEWVENFGIPEDCHYVVNSYVMENPQLMQSFQEVARPEDNEYIFHPDRAETAFVTNRSMHACSDIMYAAESGGLDNATLESALVGAVGRVAGSELFNYSRLIADLPKLDDIHTSPLTAMIPTGASALMMIVHRGIQSIERETVDAWVTYVDRLNDNCKSYFLNAATSKHPKQSLIMNNRKFQEFADRNVHMYSADKR